MTQYSVGAGQTSSGITLNKGDTLTVLSGGIAAEIIVNSGGVETISSGGVAAGATVNVNGLVWVSAGGEISGAQVNNGNLIVLSGGSAVSTTGGLNVFGTASNTSVQSGQEMLVQSGGSAIDTTLLGGQAAANPGSTIGGNTAISGGLLTVYEDTLVSGTLDFASASGGSLRFVNLPAPGPLLPGVVISGFVPGDSIQVPGTSLTIGAGNLVTISDSGPTYTLQLDPNENFTGDSFYSQQPATFELVPPTPLESFVYTFADGQAYYTGTVAVSSGTTPGTQVIRNSSGQVIGSYVTAPDGLANQPVGTVNLDRLVVDGVPFILTAETSALEGMPLNLVSISNQGLGSEIGQVLGYASHAVSDMEEPSLSLSIPTVLPFPQPNLPAAYISEVDQFYQNVLGRSPDASGLVTYATALANGMSAATALQLLANSGEAQNDLNALYLQVLGRKIDGPAQGFGFVVDRSGDATFTAFLANGGSLLQVQQSLAGSSEAQRDIGGFYQAILGRAADPGGLATYTSALASGAPQALVINNLAYSNEAANDLAAQFQSSMARAPDAAELTGMKDQLSTSGTMSGIIFGGGVTTFSAVAGNSALTAEPLTPTLFDFTTASFGNDTIAGFDVTRDTIQLPKSLVVNFAALQNDTTNVGGSSLVTFSPQQSILINGVASATLSAANFRFT